MRGFPGFHSTQYLYRLIPLTALKVSAAVRAVLISVEFHICNSGIRVYKCLLIDLSDTLEVHDITRYLEPPEIQDVQILSVQHKI
jgi:hypothetical protein